MDIKIPPFAAQQELQRDERIPEKMWQVSFNVLLLQTINTFIDQRNNANSPFSSEISTFLLTAAEDHHKEGMNKESCQQRNIPCWIFNISNLHNQTVSRSLNLLMIQDQKAITGPADSASSQQVPFLSLERANKECIISDLPVSGFSPGGEAALDFVEGSLSEIDISINKSTYNLREGFHKERQDITISDFNEEINLSFNNREGQDFLHNFLSTVNGSKSSLNYLSPSSVLIKDNRVISSFKGRESFFREIESEPIPELLSSASIGFRNSGQASKEIMGFRQVLNTGVEKIEFSSYLENDVHGIKVSLEHDGLGRLEISLNTQKGMIKGYIHAFDLHSRKVIERNLVNIISMLQREGIHIGSLTVGLGREGRYGNGEKERLFNPRNGGVGATLVVAQNNRAGTGPVSTFIKEPLIKGLSIFV